MTSNQCGCCIPLLEQNVTETKSTKEDGLIYDFEPISIIAIIWAKNVDRITVKQEEFTFIIFILIR